MQGSNKTKLKKNTQVNTIIGFRLVSLKTCQLEKSFETQIAAHKRNLSNFINMLHDPYRSATFTLRTIIDPHGSQQALGKVEIGLFVSLPDQPSQAIEDTQIKDLASNLKLLLGGIFTHYIWEEITEADELMQFTKPLDWPNAYVAEVRRREESIQLDTLIPHRKLGFMGEAQSSKKDQSPDGVYYVHPFSPPERGFETLINTLMQGKEKIVLSASISPTELSKEETKFFQEQIAYCEGHTATGDGVERVQQLRAENLGHALLRQYLVLQDAPFYMTFSIASQKPIDAMLMEYIGLSVTEPIGHGIQTNYAVPNFSFHVGGYDIVVPLADKDAGIARKNMADFAQKPWQNTQLSPERSRLRYLFDGNEAISAFYLPINTENDILGMDTYTLDERPLPRELVELRADKESNILIGKNHYFGFEQDVIIPVDTRRQHTYIIGQTGTGKTTLMKTMILSDMKAGNGLAVIDPHGELFRDLLEMIPEERKEDVVLFDPSDVAFPVGFNLLEVKGDEEREYIIKEIRAIMNRFLTEYFNLKDGDILGPVFFTHVQNNMLLTTSDEDNPGTIVEFYNIFEIPGFWKRWLPLKYKNRWLENWVENILPKTDYDKTGYNGLRLGDYFSSKFVDFVNDPRINLIFGQPHSTIDLEEVVREKKIFLVNLSKGLLGEANASLLGMMLMAKLNSVFMHRLKDSDKLKELNPFYLYVDEFQSIATENFSILLAEARKFGLGLILANQYMKQISDHKILDAIIGNVGTMISFRLGVEDAEQMANQFRPYFDAQAISELPNYQAIMRTNVRGERTVPCNFKTMLTPISEIYADPKEVINLSREKYTTPRNLADLIVLSSLENDRQGKAEFYWEKKGTPKKQLLTSLNWKALMPLFYPDEALQNKAHKKLSETVQRKIFHTLTHEHSQQKHVLANLLKIIEDDDVSLIDHMDEALNTLFEPALGDTIHWVRGIYNAAIRGFLMDKISRLEPLASNENDGIATDQLKVLCERDQWLAAGTNIARMWREKRELIPFFNSYL